MNGFKQIIILTFFLEFLFSCDMAEVDGEALVSIYMKSINQKNEKYNRASGFFISPTDILTAYHLTKGKVKDHFYIKVQKDGKYFAVRKARLVRTNKNYDLALIRTLNYETNAYLNICKNSKVFDEVVAAEYAQDEPDLSYGAIFLKGSLWIKTTTVSVPGRSGAPLINVKRGCVEGIIKGSVTTRRKSYIASFGTYAEHINQFLNYYPGSWGSDIEYVEK